MSKKANAEEVILDVPTTYAGEPHEVGEKITVAPHDARWLVEGERAHRPQRASPASPSTTSPSEVADDE